jgi:uncharacterized membrane protein YhdT
MIFLENFLCLENFLEWKWAFTATVHHYRVWLYDCYCIFNQSNFQRFFQWISSSRNIFLVLSSRNNYAFLCKWNILGSKTWQLVTAHKGTNYIIHYSQSNNQQPLLGNKMQCSFALFTFFIQMMNFVTKVFWEQNKLECHDQALQ